MIERMEMCTARGISNFPLILPNHLAPKHIQSLQSKTDQFPFILKQVGFNSGLRYNINLSLRSTPFGETSTKTAPYATGEPEADDVIIVEDARPDEKKEDCDTQLNEVPQGGSLADDPLQLFKFLEDLDLKFDYEDTYSLLVFGGGAVVALWLAAAVVGAIDSIPVFPKVLELVGLGYTLWFSSRYLIFKENRDELVARVEQIKQQVLGS